MRKTTRKFLAATAGVASIALLATACSSDDPKPASTGDATKDSKPITLTVATFNNFGYTDELLAEYTKTHPNVTVKQTVAAKSEDARTNLTTKLAAGGAGLADVEAIEIDWLPELIQSSDKFLDLNSDEVEGRWLEFKTKPATAADGKLIGYGTDVGPEAICYRSDLFEAAGLPTDPAEVAELLGGDGATWDKYFEVGKTFVDKSESAWFDSANAIYQGMVNQLEAAYENTDGTPIPLAENDQVKGLYETVTGAQVQELSAHLGQWSEDWTASFQKNGFATMLCPAWMTGPIEQNSGGITGWNIADVFPGGGGNWGGSYLTVPAAGANAEAAKELAAWLTSPEIQVKAFLNAGTFPSQTEALTDPALTDAKNDFFNNAPVGTIFGNRYKAIKVTPFKGPNYFSIHQTVGDAITKVDVDKSADSAAAWQGALDAFNALGL
ncbi:cellobiose transport system substrate-binding protein [Cellulomonas uda]|uniref:Sugar ABC transporter substrate-binding protein n=3 Tax=Cellulomonas uda TaxID=1714 RepID=A0A4Y3KFK1_CELUD|nr:ABC transporter substrate-binding protein [Cellulomonas uda]NII65247.1 cellobiose transport system substrate-binding protein [Cellulomonas uda]GEA81825.1 sugar ABC transporter substrate-binding protein [Cellulomonas uda]